MVRPPRRVDRGGARRADRHVHVLRVVDPADGARSFSHRRGVDVDHAGPEAERPALVWTRWADVRHPRLQSAQRRAPALVIGLLLAATRRWPAAAAFSLALAAALVPVTLRNIVVSGYWS